MQLVACCHSCMINFSTGCATCFLLNKIDKPVCLPVQQCKPVTSQAIQLSCSSHHLCLRLDRACLLQLGPVHLSLAISNNKQIASSNSSIFNSSSGRTRCNSSSNGFSSSSSSSSRLISVNKRPRVSSSCSRNFSSRCIKIGSVTVVRGTLQILRHLPCLLLIS